MQRRTTTYGALALTLVLAVSVTALTVAAPAEGAGEDVTFQNKGRFTYELLVAYGADAECSDMPTKKNLTLASKESQVVSSGSSMVCWCGIAVKNSDETQKISRCGAWNTAKPGRKVRVGS